MDFYTEQSGSWEPRPIDPDADAYDVASEIERRDWRVVDCKYGDHAEKCAIHVIPAYEGWPNLSHDHLPVMWRETDGNAARWRVSCASESPLRARFILLVGHMYACGLNVVADEEELMRAIERVEVEGRCRLYSMTAITAAQRLADEIASGKITATVVTDLEGADSYLWPTLFITELAQEQEREVGLVWVVECPSRVTVGEIITAYQIGHCERDELREAIRAAAESMGIVHIDAVDSDRYYTSAPMPAWYVREHCDVM